MGDSSVSPKYIQAYLIELSSSYNLKDVAVYSILFGIGARTRFSSCLKQFLEILLLYLSNLSLLVFFKVVANHKTKGRTDE